MEREPQGSTPSQPFCRRENCLPRLGRFHRSFFVDYNAAALNGRSWISVIRRPSLIVVHHPARIAVPDLDAESIDSTAAVHLAINGCEHKTVVAGAIDFARAFELRSRACDHEPLIGFAVKIEIRHAELELGLPCWDRRSFLVLTEIPRDRKFPGTDNVSENSSEKIIHSHYEGVPGALKLLDRGFGFSELLIAEPGGLQLDGLIHVQGRYLKLSLAGGGFFVSFEIYPELLSLWRPATDAEYFLA